MTYKEAMKLFKSKHPDRKIGQVYEFEEGFFIVAPHAKNFFNDTTDPTFVMSKDGKKIYQFVVSSDIESYRKMVKNKVYDFVLDGD